MKKEEIVVSPTYRQSVKEGFFNYFELSSMLFDREKEEIFDVSDIPKNSKFRKMAEDTASNLGINWKSMSHQDSNRIMLSMLEETFNVIRLADSAENVILEWKIKVFGHP